MRTLATLTPLFLHTPLINNTAQSSLAVQQQEEPEPVHYSPAKHGTVGAFIGSSDFGKFKEEYTEDLERIADFVDAHGDQLQEPLTSDTKNMVKAYLRVLKQHLFNSEGNYFIFGTDHRTEMYGTGKQWFHELVKLVQDQGIRLQMRMDTVVALAPRLDACAGGILSDLQGAIATLKSANYGLKGAAYRVKKQMMEALILEHVMANHNERLVGDEIHYVNAYYNELADLMGMQKMLDPFADGLMERTLPSGEKEITSEKLEACRDHLIQKLKLKPTHLAAAIADEYRGRIEERLRKEKLAPASIDSEGYEKVKTILKDLASEYGEISPHNLLEENEDDTTMAYIGARQPTRGTRHFLRVLKNQGLVHYDQQKTEGKKSSVVLGTIGEDRIKMLNDLLWRKEGKGKYGTIQELPESSLLRLDPRGFLDMFEQADTNARERTLMLHNLVGRMHTSLEAAGDAAELLGPWLSGFAAKMQEVAARQPSGEGSSWEPGWSDPVTLLAVAFDQGPALRELLKAGADKNVKNEKDRAALMLAAEKDYVGVVTALLENGAEIEAKDENGMTPLMLAAEKGYVGVVTALLENGAEIEAKDNYEMTPLMLAAEKGYVGVVMALLENGAEIEAEDENGMNPLLLAAEKGYVGVVTALLENGAEIEAKDNYEMTPLMLAIGCDHIEVVKALLENGAETEAEDENGMTPLLLAAEKGYVGVVTALLENGAKIEAKDENGMTPLMIAAAYDHIEVVKALIENGANKDEIKEKLPNIILLDLIGHTQETIIEKLQEFKNLEIDARQVGIAEGYSVLHLAFQALQEDKLSGEQANVLISSLIQFGVDVNARDLWQRTPLFDAVFSDALMRELIEHGADVNAVMKDGYTPIFMAWNQHALDLLVQHGANPNHKNDKGLTPLRYGIHLLNLENEIFQGLINAGATIDEEFRKEVIEKVRKAHPDREGAVPEVEADATSWIRFFADEAALYGVKN